MTTLDQISSFQHPGVIARFQKQFPHKASEAELIFKDLMQFFWASEKHELERKLHPQNKELDFTFIMDEKMLIIDQMWHIFLLYTKDYEDFCQRNFNQFIHHLPDIVPGMPQDPEAFEVNLRKFLQFSLEHLGEETVRRWFDEP